MIDAMKRPNSYSFIAPNVDYEIVETKSGKKYFISGIVAAGGVDLVGDVCTDDCMDDIAVQLKGRDITMDLDHEVWRDPVTQQPLPMPKHTIPIAKIVEVKRTPHGVWAKAQLNNNLKKFNEIWGSVKEGFLTGFSIAYKALNFANKHMKGMDVRMLNKVNILNIALTGVPVNQGALIDNFGMKSSILKSIEDFENTIEVKNMPEDNSQPAAPAAPAQPAPATAPADPATPAPADPAAPAPADPAPADPAKPADPAPADPKAPAAPAPANPGVEGKSLQDVVNTLVVETKSLRDENKALQAELKSFKEKAVFKSPAPTTPAEPADPGVQLKGRTADFNVLDLIA